MLYLFYVMSSVWIFNFMFIFSAKEFEHILLEFTIAQPVGLALESIFDDVRFLGHLKLKMYVSRNV